MNDAKGKGKSAMYAGTGDGEASGKGWNAGRKPGKPGKVGAQFPLETKGAKGKLPMGGGKAPKGKGK